MKERIIIGVVIFVLLCTIIAVVVNSAMIVSGSQANEYTEEELVQLIADAQFIKDNAHIMAESARALGWTDDDDLIIELKEKWHLADKDEVKYQELLNKVVELENKFNEFSSKPVEVPQFNVNELKGFLLETMAESNLNLNVHDFRVVVGESHTNLIFDLVIPYEYPIKENEVCSKIAKAVEEKRPNCYCVITVDRC